MKKKKPDFIFECKKCNSHVYVNKKKVEKMLGGFCNECGEEENGLWLLIGEGDFKTYKNELEII